MKANKIVIGAVSAAMLSLSVCSIAPVFAAGETVQITVGNTEAKAGEKFSVDISLANVPSTGIQCCDFAIKYDSSLVTIDSVEAGELANTAAVKDDPSASMLSIFDSSISNDKGVTAIIWSTALEDSSYWMNGDGVFCTVKGTVAAGATGKIPLEVVPASRDTYTGSQVPNEVISVGYFNNKDVVRYGVKTNNGTISIGGEDTTTTTTKPIETTTTTTTTNGGNDKPTGLKGDVNLDGKVSLADAVLIMQALSNPDDYKLEGQRKLNADTNSDGGVSPSDALEIQLHDLGLPSALDS